MGRYKIRFFIVWEKASDRVERKGLWIVLEKEYYANPYFFSLKTYMRHGYVIIICPLLFIILMDECINDENVEGTRWIKINPR